MPCVLRTDLSAFSSAIRIDQEYQKSNPSLLVENAEMNNVVYLFKCENSTLTVKGKINGIIVDSCKKCSILFDNLVASIEFVNCQSVQMQVLGSVPTISIDKTDGCQMYLSDKSLDVEIISSKSSEMNVLIPKSNGDYVSDLTYSRKLPGSHILLLIVCITDRETRSGAVQDEGQRRIAVHHLRGEFGLDNSGCYPTEMPTIGMHKSIDTHINTHTSNR